MYEEHKAIVQQELRRMKNCVVVQYFKEIHLKMLHFKTDLLNTSSKTAFILLKDGTFSVPMQALLPKHHLAFPEHLNFTMCAVKDSTELSFEMNNTR